jgi:hypothetical protein
MNRDFGTWAARIVTLAVLAAAGAQTLSALGVTGAFDSRTATVMVPVPPAYQAVDRALDRREPRAPVAGVRDPFEFHLPHRTPAAPGGVRRRAAVVESAPLLTAIVWDNDPRALVRWKDREWTVRDGGLFDEFQVVSITRDQVTLLRGASTIVLHRKTPGEQP